MSLPNLQAELAEAIASKQLPTTDIIEPLQHIRIYQNNMLTTLVQTLIEVYPLLTKLLGEDFFRIAADDYIKQYPSTSGNLHDYGEYFSDFVAEYEPVKHLVYLPEVAQFEWECHRLFFAADHAKLDIALLEKISQDQYPQLHFMLHPASQLMQFQYPILRIIDLCEGKLEETLDLNEGGDYLLMMRREKEISLVSLTLSDYLFLTALKDEEPLSEALDAALSVDANFKLDAKLPAWINDKIIVDCYLSM